MRFEIRGEFAVAVSGSTPAIDTDGRPTGQIIAMETGDVLPVVGSPPSFDPATHRLSGPLYAFDVDKVVRTWTVVANVTADDVRGEARRRMRVLFSARDDAHLDVLISNGTREAVRLLRKGESAWTDEEKSRAEQLGQHDAAMEAIRTASNAMEPNPPSDYQADVRWPTFV